MIDDKLQIPTFYIQQVAEQLAESNVDIDKWLSNYRLTFKAITSQNSLITIGDFKHLINSAVQLSGKSDFGLMVGKNLGLTTHGMLGFAVMASRDIGEAFNLIARYLNIRTPLLRMNMEEDDSYLTIWLSESYDLGDSKRAILESAVAALCNMVHHIAPELEAIESVSFPFSEPLSVDDYRQALLTEVFFSSNKATIKIPRDKLTVPLKMGNQSTLESAKTICESELEKWSLAQTWHHRVRMILLNGDFKFYSLAETADRLHLSSRTLHRRLRAERTSFSKIKNSVLHLKATTLLGNSALSIKQISEKLGYAEPPAFRKAFRNWTGMSPRTYRKTL
jgi:AraC-like DNA-binding protein